MRSLNPDHLRAIAEVVAQGSFTRAARRLNLAQPTVSLQVRELEARLGVRLVERLGKRAFATAAGRELIEHGRRIAEETERLIAAMRRHRDGWLGQVRVGCSTTALIYHLPPVLQALRTGKTFASMPGMSQILPAAEAERPAVHRADGTWRGRERINGPFRSSGASGHRRCRCRSLRRSGAAGRSP